MDNQNIRQQYLSGRSLNLIICIFLFTIVMMLYSFFNMRIHMGRNDVVDALCCMGDIDVLNSTATESWEDNE